MPDNRKWTGKSKGNKTGHQIFVFLIKHFGVGAAYFLLVFVSAYFFITKWQINKHIFTYFRKLGFGKLKSFFSVYQNYFVFGQSLIDRVAVMAGFNNRYSFSFDGENHLLQMIETGKGGIMLSAHTGNWEIAGHFLDRLNIPVHIVMVDNEYQKVKAYLENVTGKRKADIITISDDQSHLYKIIDAINRNELVCIHADRLLSSRQKTIEVALLGQLACFPYSIFKMIVTLGVPVSFVFAHKEKNLHYRFFATEPRQYSGSNKEAETRHVAEDYVKQLEKKLYQYPLQWFNYYNFWEKKQA